MKRFDVWRARLEHLRAVDKARLVRQMGTLDEAAAKAILVVLREMFRE